ncbi:hypothetical protein CDAR_257891 [Caerostris darwini]|uniref:Uncharacterized protein n=1 Tax=Caerostris darwini TaxID=1538125 RepID=A0AAV4WXI8_9ARAC|nr:hypothetical protein CDAR_257891 [Caerostris darwini]
MRWQTVMWGLWQEISIASGVHGPVLPNECLPNPHPLITGDLEMGPLFVVNRVKKCAFTRQVTCSPVETLHKGSCFLPMFRMLKYGFFCVVIFALDEASSLTKAICLVSFVQGLKDLLKYE